MSDPRPERMTHHNRGTVAHVIKHATDGLFWGQYGWSHAIDRALRFPLAMDAKATIEGNVHLRDKAVVHPHAFDDDVRDPTATHDYDPYGFNNRG